MRIIHTLNMFTQVKQLEGNVIECGVAAGTITFPLLSLMRELTRDKILYACDTFHGLPYDDAVVTGVEMKKGECNYGEAFKKIATIHNSKHLVMVEGLVEETLPKQLKDEKFCFAWIDMDCYQPTSFTYEFLEDRMVEGGIIGFHDYRFKRCRGIEHVVEEEVDRKKFVGIFCAHNCYYMKRLPYRS